MMIEASLFSFRKKIPLIRQTELAECGLACMAMIANAHGLNIDLLSLRQRFQPSLRGYSLRALIDIADKLGFNGRPVKLSLLSLGQLKLPAILHWKFKHFVVVERVRGNQAYILDPNGIARWYKFSELDDSFTGVALEITPANTFMPSDERVRLKFSQLWSKVSGLKRALLQVLLLSVILQAYLLVAPFYIQFSVDKALPARDHSLLSVFALGFALLALFNAVAYFMRSQVFVLAGQAVSSGISINVARRLLRLPIEWFERRQVGDILTRFSSIVPIQQALTQNTITALLDGVFALTLLAIMFFYSVALTVFTLLALMLYLLVRAVTYRPQRDLQEQVLIARAREQSSLIEAVRGIATLRLFGKESARHAAWSGLLIDSTNADIRYSRVGIFQSTTNVAVFTLEAVATVWLAVGLVIEGSFTTGMVFAFLAYKIQFVARATSFVDQAIIFKMLSLHLERLADIALAEEDDAFKEQASAIERCPRGRLELENVVFRYSPAEPLILDGASLRIECGEHVAITGASGSGKTTLMKVMLGLAHIQGGEIIVDGESLERFGIRNYRSGIAAVMQNDTLFSGSLASNIALFDEQVDQERLLRAAENASILEDILRMPMRFETLVGDMGSTLSGGQKQRVLLARALYRDPKILFMDEGTAHLDVALEREVSSKIAAMGITRIIVAHRPDTVRAADRVLRVENGRVYPVSSAEVQHASTGIAASGG